MIEKYLCDRLNNPVHVRPKKMQETIQLCITEMHRQSAEYEERTGFLALLSVVLRFEGVSIFGLQMLALLVSCLGIVTVAGIPVVLPAFMPLFGLAVMPVLYRSQAYGMCEMEAVTRASGAQIVLAKLILAGAAELLCMTAMLCVEVSVWGVSDQIMRTILYIVVPFLVCMVELLRSIRTCRHRSTANYAAVSLIACVGWGISARYFPWLYETSATGLWIVGFIVFASFFIREICFIIQMRKEGKMYGTIS
ncbi:MAG: hypothetical protein K2O65_01340 [Lachnospiraceae bacterium]|nr:hypothetical protein [Lachnospiraceae bacterium]